MAGTTLIFLTCLVAGIGVYGSPATNSSIPNVPVYHISIPIDHFNTSDHRTYKNRYYINDTYYKPGGPVFFFDYGEQGLSPKLASTLLKETGSEVSAIQLAKKFNGVAILWEHRYFGESLPFPLVFDNGTITTPAQCALAKNCTHNPRDAPSSYRYLTIEQALEDAVYFAHRFTLPPQSKYANQSVTPKTTPWIWIGGSYPGSRAAWIRIRNPETFYASWSSSAPVETRVDGGSYYNVILHSLPSNCRKDAIAAVQHADEIMAGKHGKEAFIKLQELVYTATATGEKGLQASYSKFKAYGLRRSEIGRLLIDRFTTSFQTVGPVTTTDRVCRFIETYDPNAKPMNTSTSAMAVLSNAGEANPPAKGIAATYNASVALDAYIYGYRCYQAAVQEELDLIKKFTNKTSTPTPNDKSADMASWIWLVNTEIGALLGSNPTNKSNPLLSRFYTYQDHLKDNGDYFAFNANKVFTHKPDTSVGHKYGGWNMAPSNVMFTNGELDPWRSFSVQSEEYDLGAPRRKLVQDIPPCNKAPENMDVFGLVYAGQAHGGDLLGSTKNASAPLARGLKLFGVALEQWLPCYQPARD